MKYYKNLTHSQAAGENGGKITCAFILNFGYKSLCNHKGQGAEGILLKYSTIPQLKVKLEPFPALKCQNFNYDISIRDALLLCQ